MKASALLFVLCLSIPLTARSENTKWPEYTVSQFDHFSEYFDGLVPYFERGMDASRAQEAYQHFGFESIAELTPFLSHESRRVRWHAMAHLWKFISYETDASKCRLTLSRLIECLINDKDIANTQWLERRIPIFPEHYYNENSKRLIKGLLAGEYGPKIKSGYLVLAAGIAHPERIEAVLEECRQSLPRSVAMAMARLGHLDELDRIIDYESPDSVTRPPALFGELPPSLPAVFPDIEYMRCLAYTKQPAAIQKLVNFAFSERMQPGSDDYGPSYTAGWAIGVLSMIFSEFPLTDESSAHYPEKITMAREWLKTHYSADNPLALLNGQEVKAWR